MSQKVIDATELAKQRFADEGLLDQVQIEWELQLDAAIVPSVAEKKVKDGSWGWEANVLVFPDLNSGNIGYKLIQYYGRAQAVGPLIQGLNKPGNDLSRGCSVDDIKVLHAITVIQAEKAGK
jgi:phosphate acetyltransferase